MSVSSPVDWRTALGKVQWFRLYGRVARVTGMIIESVGPYAKLGDVCKIRGLDGSECLAEVVGFREANLLLMPLGELTAVAPGSEVLALHAPLSVCCGPWLLGRVVDGLGRPIDGLGPFPSPGSPDTEQRPLESAPPHPLARRVIDQPIATGVRAIDGLLTVGEGQRIGIFAGSGVGKSTLLSMMARNTSADVNVIALVGERGREVNEFLERDLGAEGRRRSVVVVSTSDQPPLIRLKAALVATAMAEYFRDQGLRVNLMMDSVTRYAMALREVGLASGEPPTSRGYTPSVFARLPRLLERAGNGPVGSITGFYTVLVDGDDMNDPIADAVRGILDGHIVLSRALANEGRFPAIDVLASASRLFQAIVPPEQWRAAAQVRAWMQRYRDVEDLLRIGAYRQGADPETDVAIARWPRIREFLLQDAAERSEFAATRDQLLELAGVRGEP
ncbi:FliI/YscN family ATPase [Alicyclobacillus cellulosilyticus]|nr:FliI/YscN family ATPase [Alicyclobacillus cellulosilyticus]